MNITGEQLAEAMRQAGMEVQYFPLKLAPAADRKPHTCGSVDLGKIAAALNQFLAKADLLKPAQEEEIDPVEQYFRDRAQSTVHEDGHIELDHNAKVSIGEDDGAYVQAWVWIERGEPQNEEAKEEQNG